MHYAVFGVGRQGLAAVYDLVKYCDAQKVWAYDIRLQEPSAVNETKKYLQDVLGSAAERIQLSGNNFSQKSDWEPLIAQLRQTQCLISALPYALNGQLSELAIAAGVPMCDMGGNPEMVDDQKSLAEKHHHILVPECGLAPGIINILIKHLVQHHQASQIKSYCGGLPKEKPEPAKNPLQYKLVFSPAGLISEYMGRCPVLRGGKIEYAPALMGWECFDDQHEAFYTSNNSPRILDYLAQIGVQNYEYKTLRYQGHLEKIQVLKSLGFLQGRENVDRDLEQRLSRAEVLRFDRTHDQDKVMVSIRGRSASGQNSSIDWVEYLDEKTRLTAMELTTSWGTTIVAQALAKGICRPKNFATPEQFMDTSWFISELKKRTTHLIIRG